ncbi:MAG: hypothetical protein J6Y01_06810, partial [Spirochaetales bacterium]|nr:hypothetical protein [Spirochaetales bacterium]
PDHKAVITFKIEEDEFSDPFEQFPPYFYIRFIDDKRDGAGNMLEPYQESAPYPEKTVHDIEVNINSIMGDITVGLGG